MSNNTVYQIERPSKFFWLEEAFDILSDRAEAATNLPPQIKAQLLAKVNEVGNIVDQISEGREA